MEADAVFYRRWQGRRSLFNWCLTAWFVLLAFFLGPLYFNWAWGVKPPPKTPDYFAPTVQRYCEPVVRRMKEYERIHGKRPTSFDQFAPELRQTEEGQAMISDGRYLYEAELRHLIEYDFTPGHEQWIVHGHFVNGVINVPPVKLDDVSTTKP